MYKRENSCSHPDGILSRSIYITTLNVGDKEQSEFNKGAFRTPKRQEHALGS